MKEIKLLKFNVSSQDKTIFPQVFSGKENLDIKSKSNSLLLDILSRCYDVPETEIQILLLIAMTGEIRTEDLIRVTGLSETRINRALNRLVERQLIVRIKEYTNNNKKGRPKFVYKVMAKDPKQKIVEDIRSCMERMIELVEKEFSST